MQGLREHLNKHIVVYKKDFYSKKSIRLCKIIAAAKLSPAQNILLKNYKEIFGVLCVVIVYDNPILFSNLAIFETVEKK